MRIAFAVVIAAVLLTSCVRRPGAYVVDGSNPYCIERLGLACPSSVCVEVRVMNPRGRPIGGAVVAVWSPGEAFEEGASPTPLRTAETGSQGRVILYLEGVGVTPEGVQVTADGRPVGHQFVFAEGAVHPAACVDFVLPPVPQEWGP